MPYRPAGAGITRVAEVFRGAGPVYRTTHAGHLSLHQLKIMSAIEQCRTAAMGGHVEACSDCGHWRIAYNGCRNRDCPKCQGVAERTWLAEREADLLPVGYLIERQGSWHSERECGSPRWNFPSRKSYSMPYKPSIFGASTRKEVRKFSKLPPSAD